MASRNGWGDPEPKTDWNPNSPAQVREVPNLAIWEHLRELP